MTINMVSGSKVNRVLWGVEAGISIVGGLMAIDSLSGIFSNTKERPAKKAKRTNKKGEEGEEKIKNVKCKVIKDKTKKKK